MKSAFIKSYRIGYEIIDGAAFGHIKLVWSKGERLGKMAIKRWTRFRMAVLIFVVWLFAFGVFIGIFYLSNRHNTQKYADEGNIKLFYTIHHSVEGMLNETSQTLLDLLINRQDNRLINGFCANTSGDLQSVQELLFSVMQKKSYIFDIFLLRESYLVDW